MLPSSEQSLNLIDINKKIKYTKKMKFGRVTWQVQVTGT